MKFGTPLAILCSIAAVACAQTAQTPFTYSEITAHKRAIVSESKLMKKLGERPVVLDLVPYSYGSDAFYERGKKSDEIAFLCPNPGWNGGTTTGTIVRIEAGEDGGHSYRLNNCTKE